MKGGKATGEDEVENEIWKYGGKGIKRAVRKVCNIVWIGAG